MIPLLLYFWDSSVSVNWNDLDFAHAKTMEMAERVARENEWNKSILSATYETLENYEEASNAWFFGDDTSGYILESRDYFLRLHRDGVEGADGLAATMNAALMAMKSAEAWDDFSNPVLYTWDAIVESGREAGELGVAAAEAAGEGLDKLKTPSAWKWLAFLVVAAVGLGAAAKLKRG